MRKCFFRPLQHDFQWVFMVNKTGNKDVIYIKVDSLLKIEMNTHFCWLSHLLDGISSLICAVKAVCSGDPYKECYYKLPSGWSLTIQNAYVPNLTISNQTHREFSWIFHILPIVFTHKGTLFFTDFYIIIFVSGLEEKFNFVLI